LVVCFFLPNLSPPSHFLNITSKSTSNQVLWVQIFKI
jgi:hypothetical protein